MQLSPAEARSALDDIQRTSALSAKATGYRRAAPHLLLWGAIWTLGYGAPALAPQTPNWIWLALDAIGLVGSFVIGMRTPGPVAGKTGGHTGRVFAASAVCVLFVIATLTVMQPTQTAQLMVFPALLLGLVYGLVGVFGRSKFLWIAAAAPACALLAYFFFQPWLGLTMAVVGGGGLMLSGLWMRSL
jgi:hypothetical protein